MKKKTKIIKYLFLIFLLILFFSFIYFSYNKTNDAIITNITQNNNSIINNEKISVANFNIQTFGKTKSSKSDVMNVLVDIAENFDLMNVQEVKDEATAKTYAEKVNYSYILSKALGRTSNKEYYEIIYNDSKINYVENSAYVYDDVNDVFEREPYIAEFKSGSFDFVLISIHIKPSDAKNELNNLFNVFVDVKNHFPNNNNFIILGDMNYDCDYANENDNNIALRNPELVFLINNSVDTTIGLNTCTYDRIIVSNSTLTYYDNVGVFRFNEVYNLSLNFSKTISDHYPIWAEFKTN